MNQTKQLQSTDQLKQRPFLFYMKRNKRAFAFGVTALLFTNFFDVLTPLGLKAGIDAITHKDPGGLLRAVGLYVGLMTGVTVCRYFWRIYFGRFHLTAAEDLRNRIYTKLTELGPSFFQKNPTGQLMSLITNDVNTFRMAIGPGTLILLDAIFLIAMIVPVMITLSWDWTWKTLVLLPFVPFFMRKMEALIHELYRVEQDKLSEVSGHAQEIVSGVRVIKGFAQESNQLAKFNVVSREYEDACNAMAKVDSAFHPVMEFAVACGSVILLFFCTPAVVRDEVTLGTFVAFHEYIKRMIWPMSAIGMGVSMHEQGRASFARIRELLSTETDIPDTGKETLPVFKKLELRNVTFRYPGSPVEALKNINLTIHAGETIGIVGPVGAGKTTLLQLLCRMFPLQQGQILFNGIEIADLERASLASTVSVVPQDAFLFSETIAENVALGLNEFPGLESIERATTMVNIDREIRELPEKYEAYLGERGVNLSGGQKQRLTIARAMIRRSPIVLLDDSLSAVDGTTEKAIVRELKAARIEDHSQTVLIVSHRLATLKHADRIVVLQRGEIEAVGTHEELIVLSPTYRTLHHLQNSPVSAAVSGDPEILPMGGA